MTASHRYRRKKLRHDIDGKHDENRIQKSLQITADAGGLDLVVSDQHKDHQCPGKFRHQVCRWAPDAQQADKIGNDRCGKDRTNQGNVVIKAGAHIAPNKFQQSCGCNFRHRLLPGDIRDLQSMTQPDTQGRDQDQHQPADHQGLGYLNRAENRHILYGSDDLSAVD